MSSPSTVRELSPAVGSVVLVRLETLSAWCRVLDAKSSYGKPRLLVTPVNGCGEAWVELHRIAEVRPPATPALEVRS